MVRVLVVLDRFQIGPQLRAFQSEHGRVFPGPFESGIQSLLSILKEEGTFYSTQSLVKHILESVGPAGAKRQAGSPLAVSRPQWNISHRMPQGFTRHPPPER